MSDIILIPCVATRCMSTGDNRSDVDNNDCVHNGNNSFIADSSVEVTVYNVCGGQQILIVGTVTVRLERRSSNVYATDGAARTDRAEITASCISSFRAA